MATEGVRRGAESDALIVSKDFDVLEILDEGVNGVEGQDLSPAEVIIARWGLQKPAEPNAVAILELGEARSLQQYQAADVEPLNIDLQ